MKTAVPLGLLLLLGLLVTQPVDGAPFNQRDPADEGSAIPESKVVDLENLTESEREFFRETVNITAIKIQQQALRDRQNMSRTSGPMAITQSTIDRNVPDRVKTRKEYAEHIIGNIKHNIESNLMRNDTVSHLAATHEMAFSAVCEMPKNTNTSQWNEDNTWNLFFRLPHNKQYNSVSSAVLRLYMNGLNSTGARNQRESGNCKNPSEQMIRITVSVYFRKNRRDNGTPERKKRICSCTTITQSYRGWITLDTLLAVKLWDKPNRNLGIAIDVEDQEDRPLRAADFFQPADCSEASKTNASAVFPWSFFGSPLARTVNEMDDVPHYPRIDIVFQRNTHHNHRLYRPKYHYGYGVRSHLANGSTAGSNTGNSYEHEDVDHQPGTGVSAGGHHNYKRPHHMHDILKKLHTHTQHAVQQPVVIGRAQMKRRHLNHHTVAINDDCEENQSISSSAMLDSTASLSDEDRNL
ncbi:protein anachronism [Anopheles moucheti]|uniref:protein anachronism n=1 Tax=Anopheles moucheti TaxID=186751 RepID=UPI0022F0C354|nr:protein anachronism [Anopheles moucheti]